MELYDVFRNQVLKHPQVCQAFIDVLETKLYKQLKSLFLSSHGEVDKIVNKRECVEMGKRSEWGRQRALVDQRLKRDEKGEWIGYMYNVRVISWVICYGHYQIIEYIIQHAAQHNETSELYEIIGYSPHQSKSGIYARNEHAIEHSRVVEKSKSGIFKKIKNMLSIKRQKKVEKLCTHDEQTEQHDETSKEQCRLLILSCYSGDEQTVRVLIPVCKKAINGIGQISEDIEWCYDTPLTAACEGGHIGIVKELVKSGANVNLQYDDGKTPLIYACKGGHVSVVEELVKTGAGVNLQDRWGNTPLIAACKRGHVSVVEKLVKSVAGVNLQDNYGDTPLIAACEGGHVSVVEELVKAGADINLQDDDGNTPLIVACVGGHVSVVEGLVKAGADVNLQDDDGNTPLTAACEGGHVSVVEGLVKAGADVNLQDNYGDTPLIAAVREGSLSAVKCLVEHGTDWVTQVVDFNVSAVYRELILNKQDVMIYLIQEQNKINPGKFTGNVHVFNCLVDIRHAGVKTDSRDDMVVTDISVWCMDDEGDLRTISEGDCDALRHLLCVGLDVNQSIQLYDKSDVRPLLYRLIDEGFVKHRTEKVSILLEAGADVNVRVRDREYDSVLDREGVSVLERTRRRVCTYSDSEEKEVICEIKKRVRRHSV